MDKENNQITCGIELTVDPFQVSAILNFLSSCDIVMAASSESLPGESCCGRGHLLGFLGHCVEQFVDAAEDAEYHTRQLHQTINTNKQRDEQLVILQGLYKQLIEFPVDSDPAKLIDLKMEISGLEKSLSLNVSDALVGFKPSMAVDKPDKQKKAS
ncbi:MAG: hypothetical protein ACI8WB_005622 [Phenylobacterium sp.]